MTVRGLTDYRLTFTGLKRLGTRSVTFSLQLRGLPPARLMRLSPRQRNARVRTALKRQLTTLTRHFPDAGLTSRDPKRGSWTLDGCLPANKIRQLAKRPEVSELQVSAIEGRSPFAIAPKEAWFCVWGVVGIQVEGRRSGMMTVEDRFVLVKAIDVDDAVDRLHPHWKRYAEPYLNPGGYLVRRERLEIRDVFGPHNDRLAPEGTEVYSRLRIMKLKPAYRWHPNAPRRRLQRTPWTRDTKPR